MDAPGVQETPTEGKRATDSEEPDRAMEKRIRSPTLSCVSMTSHNSKEDPPDFREGETPPELSAMEKRPGSPTESCGSMSSDKSKDRPPDFKEAEPPDLRAMEKRIGSPTQSSVSMGSDRSKDEPIKFKEAEPPPDLRKGQKGESQGMKDLAEKRKFREDLFNIFSELESRVMTFMKHEMERFKKLLRNDNARFYDKGVDDNYDAREGALNIAVHFLRKMNQTGLADSLGKCPIEVCQQKLKLKLMNRYGRVSEGISQQGKSELLEEIYTDVFITEGVGGTANEVTHAEKATRAKEAEDTPIKCNSIFRSETERPIKTVLTNGLAGIGKSVSVQKFIMDWVNGVANQDIELIFPLPFRELNLKNDKYSFMEILYQFFPETKGLMFTKRKDYKVLFIFDGLDECKHPLEFRQNEIWSDLTTQTSMDVLLTNLLKGNLLPNALIWITSRPAAANHIPPECIDLVSEVRGFNEEKKKEYFMRRIKDQTLAERVFKLIKESRSLYIMCHIPIFCWICATVFESNLSSQKSEEQVLKTLTQMYSHFLIFQMRRKTEKYDDGKPILDTKWDEKGTQALGKLAFHNLMSNNLIFCDSDLKESGITAEDASVYSGMCTQIFKKDSGIFFGTAFSFVHLSIQEFMAALYAHICINKEKRNVLANQDKSSEKDISTMTELLKKSVDMALKSDSGHLDLFLRFLLGLSLETNQKLLDGLLTNSQSTPQSKDEIVKYISEKLQENPSAEKSINLFHCLSELNDKSLVDNIQNQLASDSFSNKKLSPAQWSALVYVLMTSENVIETFELQKFQKSDECLKRLLPVVENATKALLADCCLTQDSCSTIAKILGSSSLKELDLSHNDIKDAGVDILACELETQQCKLETLRLSDCGITGGGYAALAKALESNSSLLEELDLRGNNPGNSGVKGLMEAVNYEDCKLRFLKSDAAEQAYLHLTKTLNENLLLQTELKLTHKELNETGLDKFCELLRDAHCIFKKLTLNRCNITESGVDKLTSALMSNPSHLIELDLGGNKIGDSGVKNISNILTSDVENAKDEQEALEVELRKPQLQRLGLKNCSIKGEGCAALISALESNPAHLKYLDLKGNDFGEPERKKISALVNDSNKTIEIK
ncbi:NACHT, LRR and PYD domains-containing protein 12-like [Engraulis encrasicolus]|uniref:NACHT, LRR and PYD domains-containing protein 12-like n=1 Tax=Engraulis encrasicolus TaxID=184585 RepID=UPI002FD4C851